MNEIRSNSTPANIQHTATHAQAASTSPSSTRCQDPLAALERELLARPGSHHHRHHYRHTTPAQLAGHLAPPTNPPNAVDRSRTPSPAPTAGARRCMAATAAWIPLTEDRLANSNTIPGAIERRQSWDGQEYRHAMMVQATGLVCACHPTEHAHKHDSHSNHHGINVPPQNSYEADRGFSEASH